jgi:hypothetical protein
MHDMRNAYRNARMLKYVLVIPLYQLVGYVIYLLDTRSCDVVSVRLPLL